MFSSEHRVGRLVELRVVTPVSPAEIVDLQKRHAAVTGQVSGEYVVAVDLRRAHVFPPEITDGFIALMSQLNPRLLRSALLINSSAILGLQAERAIESAGHPDRRAFRTPAAVEAWLAEVLDERELQRLHNFLADGADEPASRELSEA